MTRAQDIVLPIAGQDTAHFDCVFPTCGGVCCKNGRPPVEEAENARIEQNLAKILPHMTEKARARVERDGFRTERKKEGLRALAVTDGWCVFHNEGCVLHKVGALEGDRWKYKPWRCIAFPLERTTDGAWHVRQWGVEGEAWDLFCLNPDESPKKATTTLTAELAFVRELDDGKEAWRFLTPADQPTPRPSMQAR
ncbi:MAG: DUF3109 family protein [Planctomycetes bacterium]|nr:DUF3109 family protein [Planctomycetota bacterium]